MPIKRATGARMVPSDETPAAEHVNQLTGLVNGTVAIPVFLTKINDSAHYVLTAQQNDASVGRIMLLLDESGNAVLDARRTSVTIKPVFEVQNSSGVVRLTIGGSNVEMFGSVFINGSGAWHAGNDGSGSGLDADLLDGIDSTGFATASHTHTAPKVIVGSYTGNGATSIRTISTGGSWTPTWVTLVGGNTDPTIERYDIHSTAGCTYDDNAGNVRFTAGCKLSSTGAEFYVADGADYGNRNGKGYRWIAYRGE